MLTNQGYKVLSAAEGNQALSLLHANDVDVALIDLHLPGMSGIDVLKRVRADSPSTECIIFTGQGDVTTAFSSLDAGASDYFEKPIRDWQRFQQVLRRAAEVRRLKRETQRLQKRVKRPQSPLIGNSPAMEAVRQFVASVAASSASILIVGESGVGKELVAEAIHLDSGRGGEFVRINCASVPHDLLEGELFGWEKGAHSTATQSKEGLFEVANGGTVMLDEVGDMPYDIQAKLLRVRESRKFRRLGGTKEKDMNARVVAATNQDMERHIQQGKFRRDLYFRINVVTVPVPPLRERREDIPVLTYHFVRQFNEAEGREVQRISPAVLARLEACEWPGNIRELRNVLHRAVLLSTGPELGIDALGPGFASQAPALETVLEETESTDGIPSDLYDLPFSDAKGEVVNAFTVKYLKRRLNQAGGNITRAADASGLLRPNFKRLMKQFDVNVPQGNDEGDGED
jgi:DNA-binding NtrC family response regulator